VNWTEWFQFMTASEKPAPFSFIYFGDAQNDIRAHWSRVIREAHSDAPKARFIVHAGDLVNSGNRDAEWGEWFGAGGWLNAMVPSVPTPGNHEYPRVDENEDRRELSRHWRPQYMLPDNGPEGLEETVYWLDYQGTRIISMNSNEQLERQVEWLDSVLSDNPNTWTVIAFHHPVFSTARGRDNPEVRKLWKPLFDKYNVDLVLQGHDHTYARFGPEVGENLPSGVNVQSQEAGTVYVVSVSGPKMYNVDRRPAMRRAAEDTQLYQIISVDGPTLRYEARTAIGELYDAFRLEKRAGEANELVDEIPDTPERRRPAEGESK
jgi:3',5'-cyclic AMP phosphodiesterase CpdA